MQGIIFCNITRASFHRNISRSMCEIIGILKYFWVIRNSKIWFTVHFWKKVQKDTNLWYWHIQQINTCISLGSCYTKFNSTFGMDNRVLINNLSDSHQATSNEWFLVWIRDYLFCEKLPRLQFKLLLVKCIVKNTIACKTNP